MQLPIACHYVCSFKINYIFGFPLYRQDGTEGPGIGEIGYLDDVTDKEWGVCDVAAGVAPARLRPARTQLSRSLHNDLRCIVRTGRTLAGMPNDLLP